jgi:hypothetical protein
LVAGNHAGYSQELFKFSTETLAWTKLETGANVTGTGPSARYGHTMTSVGHNIYIFGGQQTDDGESKTKLEGRGKEGRVVVVGVWLRYGGCYCRRALGPIHAGQCDSSA